jgi:hypothetical protein
MGSSTWRARSIFLAVVIGATAPEGTAQSSSCCGDQVMFVSVVDPPALYVVDAYAIAPQALLVGGLPTAMTDIAIHPATGQMYGCAYNTLYAIDKTTAVGIPIGLFGGPFTAVIALEFSGTGTLFCGNGTSAGELGTVDLATGHATWVGNTNRVFGGDLAFLGSLELLGTAKQPNDLRAIDPATGSATTIGTIASNGDVWGLEFDCEGTLYGATALCFLVKIDPLTAAVITQQLILGLDKKFILGMTFERSAGAVYAYCTASTTTLGCTPSISATGDASLAASSGFQVGVASLEGLKSGLFFHGTGNLHQALVWAPGSTSTLCVASPLQRTGIQNAGGTVGSCDGVFGLDWFAYMNSHPQAVGHPLFVGRCFDLQAWFRDPSAARGSNLSDALHFELLP